MQAKDQLILIVTDDIEHAEHHKELLEFMDAPCVEIATVKGWRSQLGQRRLSAIFLGPNLTNLVNEKIIGDIGKIDPNISIVILDALTDDS